MTQLRDHFPDLPSLLAEARRRPGMYFPAKSIRALWAMLAGIEFAEDFHDVPPAARFGRLDRAGFERWVAKQYNPDQLTANSFKLAEMLADSDGAALDLWFSWYDEFLRTAGGRPAAG